MVGTSVILFILKYAGLAGIPWYWALAPIWLPLVILILPWIFTIVLLWIHQKTGGN